MSDVVIHGILGSPFVRAAMLVLEEKGQPYRFQALSPGESKGEAYLKLHPFGRIPYVEHDGFGLYETQAILRYFDQVFPEPALTPEDPKAAARMNQVMGISDWYLFPQSIRIIGFNRIVGPALMGLTPDEAACAAAVPDTVNCVTALDRILGESAYFAGPEVSLADLLVAPQLSFLAATPEGEAALKGTGLVAWLARMDARPSMQATLPPAPFRKAA